MKAQLKEYKVGNTQFNQLAETRKMISESWKQTPLLDGIEDGILSENLATLYENQYGYLDKSGILKESTTATSSGSFETVAFPLVRRVFSKLLANDIVSVQALNFPVGKLFYINPKISTRVADEDFAGHLRHSAPDSAYSNAARKKKKLAANITGDTLVEYESKSLYDAYYATQYGEFGEALFDRTKGKIEPITGSVTYDTGVYAVGTDKRILAKIGGFSIVDQGKIVGPAGVPVDTESFLASLKIFPTVSLITSAGYEEYTITTGDTVPYNVRVQKYGNSIVNPATGEMELWLDLTYPEQDYVPYSGATSPVGFTYVYNKYCNLEQDSEMAEVTFELNEVTVAVETRKLRATWTPELAKDVQVFHNIDAEAELTALLSETIANEIDQEILRDLRQVAPWAVKWDYAGLKKQAGTFYGTQKDWNQTLITKINQISAMIEKSTLRGGANWLVVSPEVSAVFNDLEYFHVSNAAADQDSYAMGVRKAGTLQGVYTVYVAPYMPANTILVGRKGQSILDTGYIYAPYVPLELTNVMQNPNDFTSIRGIMTRYAKKTVNNRFYGRILVDGLQTFGIGELH